MVGYLLQHLTFVAIKVLLCAKTSNFATHSAAQKVKHIPMKRLFLSISIPTTIKQQIANSWKPYHEWRWTTISNMHVTVLFMGDTDESELRDIANKVQAIAFNIPAFELKMKDVSAVLTPNRGAMLWITFHPSEPLELLASLLGEVLTNSSEHGFTAHLTLLRLPIGEVNDKKAVQLAKQLPVVPFSFTATQVELWETVKLERGQKYNCLQKFPLLG
jgi:2'-5' RNA ligase